MSDDTYENELLKKMDDEYKERVQRGCALLDELRPDWFNEINLPYLNMSNAKYCIAGQLYGEMLLTLPNFGNFYNFFNSLEISAQSWLDVIDWGFYAADGVKLTNLWTEEILKRRENS